MKLDSVHIGMIVAFSGKLFIELADAMPPPPESCGFWSRWFYNSIQRVASNSAKVGTDKEFPLMQPQPIPQPTPVQEVKA